MIVGDVQEAEAQYTMALEILDAAVGVDHPNRAQAFLSMAELRIDTGRGSEVIEALEHARGRLVEARGEDSRAVDLAELLLADARIDAGVDEADVAMPTRSTDAWSRPHKARLLFVRARMQRRGGNDAAARETLAALDALGDSAVHGLLRPRVDHLRESVGR